MDNDVLRERTELREAIQLLVVPVVTPCAVRDHRTGECLRTEVTDVRTTGRAVLTTAARRDERHGDVISGGQADHILADRLHDARALMTTDKGEHRVDTEEIQNFRGRGHVTHARMLVGVAHAREGHLDFDLVRLGLVDLDQFGGPGLIEARGDCSLDLHGSPLIHS